MGKKATEQPADTKPAEAKPGHVQRFTCHLPAALAEKIRDVAWWDRRTVNNVVQTAIESYIAKLEKGRGEPYEKREGTLRRGGMR